MKLFRILVAAGLALFSGTAFSQQNAINFDGVDDKVTVPNAAQFISGSSQITMTMWVKPLNNVIAFPDYDGFGGFRNNTDADFYIIQLPGNQVEARYRNSTAANFDILFSPISVGTWQHFAMVYTGTTLQLYYNGALVGSTPASGVINNASVPFDMGSLLWTGNNFQLWGDMDEVSLWSIALSAQEIACLYSNGIDPASPGLELYYNFNQGIANGNNAGTFTVTNQTGSTNGVLSGFALNGTSSNFVTGIPSFVTYDSVTICNGSNYVFGTQTLNVAGVYTEAFVSVSGCDSLVELTLDVETVDTTVIEGFGTLTASLAGATYQWLDCGNGNAPMPGDTLQILSQFGGSVPNGSYAVVVTMNGCSDTSSCHPLNANSLFENGGITAFEVYPNPATDEIRFELSKPGTVEIYDLAGRTVLSAARLSQGKQKLSVATLESGTYVIRFDDGENSSLGRFLKQ